MKSSPDLINLMEINQSPSHSYDFQDFERLQIDKYERAFSLFTVLLNNLQNTRQ